MEASGKAASVMEEFNVGPCSDAHELGFLIGQRFSNLIRSRAATDQVLQQQLLPFAHSPEAQPLLHALSTSNREKFPRYWNELLGTAAGSGVPVLEILLLNFRKEMQPFVPTSRDAVVDNDCSDILVVGDSMAMAAHNEDGNVALVGHTYLVKVKLPDGLFFTAYTYAGELPSCAFGFNSHGMCNVIELLQMRLCKTCLGHAAGLLQQAFTLNAVPPCNEQILAGGVGRNFISRDLLEATSLEDAKNRICSANASVGHSYNLIDVRNRDIVNVETASSHRVSVHKIGVAPFFHANMYLHLQVKQVQDENSISRQGRAAQIQVNSKEEMLELLGDIKDKKYPIYTTGPTLYTLCTAIIDLDEKTLSIIHGNPKKKDVSHKFQIH